MKKLCLAGGVALNCCGNGQIVREGIFEDVWVQPAAGDAGGALGVALMIWHQLLDKPDSYLESSSTAMFTFAVARGVNRGWLTPAYAPIAQTGWQALRERIRENGQIDDICVGTTAAYDAVYYYNRPTSLEAPQGYGPTLMAGAEMITLLKNFDVDRKLNTFHYKRKQ
jgi:hypothetical protein